MSIFNIIFNNFCSTPILFFIIGILIPNFRLDWIFRPRLHSFLTYFLLFSIGLKSGGSFMQHCSSQFFLFLAIMIAWGLVQPLFSYWILRKFTSADSSTAAVIAACFGSVSLMTFAAGIAFLEKLHVPYKTLVIPVLAVMEIPAILSGLFIFKWKSQSGVHKEKNIWIHTFFNKTILTIFLGIFIGIICDWAKLTYITSNFLSAFKPFLYWFLLNMGIVIGKQRNDLTQFSWSLSLFGFYMPLIGGAVGIALSYLFGLDAGTGTLIAILSASASYIAVPAAMRLAIPEAKEAIYLPLSLGIAFPFNIFIGIPIYYFLSLRVLG